MIQRIVFDDDAQELRVSFRSGFKYIYEGVPRAIYDAFKHAASAGRFFNEHVKGRYRCRPDPAGRRKYRPVEG